MVEIYEPTSLEVYTTADQLAAVFQHNSSRIIELLSELHSCVGSLAESFNNHSDFSCSVKLCHTDEVDQLPRELKRAAWKTLIDKTGIKRVMSSRKREELQEALSAKHRRSRGDDPVDQLPDITPEAIQDMLSGYLVSADEFLDEAIREEYEWLKPWQSDTYKTNVQNRWRVGRKVIIAYGLELRHSRSHCFRASYRKDNHLHTLDTIFHLLDGKWIPQTHGGPLCDAIQTIRVAGKPGETEYFRFKCYDNQNLHLEFKRPDLVDEFNFRCGNKHQLPDHEAETFHRSSKTYENADVPVAPNGDFNFFETPEELAGRICGLAEISDRADVLEPSAGSGRIARAARERGGIVQCVEIQLPLIEDLKMQGFHVIGTNFLEWRPRDFDAVVMNPPFCRGQDIAHIRHAWEFVRPGGSLVSVASSGVKYRSDKKTTAFRAWLQEVGGEVIDLPEGSFSESGTEVSTVLIVCRKPKAAGLGL